MRCIDFTPENVVVVTTDVQCGPSQYVLITSDELSTFTASPFHLSAGEGGLVAVAILGVWAAAFSVKAAVRALNSGEPET